MPGENDTDIDTNLEPSRLPKDVEDVLAIEDGEFHEPPSKSELGENGGG